MGKTKLIIKILYLAPPLAIMVGLLPLISELPPFLPKGTTNFNYFMVVIVIPYYLGLLSWPAYIFLIFSKKDFKLLSKTKCQLIRIGMLMAILCSIFGIFIGYMLPFLSLLALITLILCVILMSKFEKAVMKK